MAKRKILVVQLPKGFEGIVEESNFKYIFISTGCGSSEYEITTKLTKSQLKRELLKVAKDNIIL